MFDVYLSTNIDKHINGWSPRIRLDAVGDGRVATGVTSWNPIRIRITPVNNERRPMIIIYGFSMWPFFTRQTPVTIGGSWKARRLDFGCINKFSQQIKKTKIERNANEDQMNESTWFIVLLYMYCWVVEANSGGTGQDKSFLQTNLRAFFNKIVNWEINLTFCALHGVHAGLCAATSLQRSSNANDTEHPIWRTIWRRRRRYCSCRKHCNPINYIHLQFINRFSFPLVEWRIRNCQFCHAMHSIGLGAREHWFKVVSH